MEPQYSVLLFSKYSPNCKRLFTIIQQSGIDFTYIQLLCVDNNKVRQQIKSTNQIDIKTVPCLLLIYSNGNVEKYDGNYVFEWFNALIPKIPPPRMPSTPQGPQYQDPPEEPQEEEPEPQEAPKPRKKQVIPAPKPKDPPKPKIPSRMKPIQEESGATSIDDLPYEPRSNKTLPAPRRIRQDEGNYEEDENFFSGDAVDHRRETGNSVKKDTTQQASPDPYGTLARAKEFAQGREEIEQSINSQQRRPQVRTREQEA